MARRKAASSRPAPSLQVWSRQKTRRLNIPFLRQLVRRLLEEWPPPREQGGSGVPPLDQGRDGPATFAVWQPQFIGPAASGPGRPCRSAGSPKTNHLSSERIFAAAQLGVYFINAAEMACLNEQFLGHTGSTDVIAFDYEEETEGDGWCGEIYISVDDAVASAPRFRATWQLELARYLVHGMLHLRGYDDQEPAARRQMKREENRLLKELSRRFDWSKMERAKHVAR
jgi:probable rRNA maturation factor